MKKAAMHARALGKGVFVAGIVAASLAGCGGSSDSDNNAAGGSSGASDPNVVSLSSKGTLIGASDSTMRKFLGIPYAAPPVGDLRWKAPQPAASFAQRDATKFAPHCAQPAGSFGQASTSEDCLYLNIYTPASGSNFPVMVWIHGGALLTGESDDYDPTALVKQGVAVVTLNYRLGPLGFLAHPALSAENGGASGNYGLMDQQAAIKWVKDNIAAFGGNAANITIFGESAGGLSTHSQLASPLAAGLFQKAIVESGSYNLATPSLASATALGQAFASKAGCADQSAACLRNLPVSTIIANSAAIQVSGTTLPTVDGKVLTLSIADAFSSGKLNKVPVIEGTNQHEYSLLSAATVDARLGHPITSSDYPTQINAVFGSAIGAAVQNAYPPGGAPTPAWAYDNALTDAVFACNGRTIARNLSANGVTVYAYEFADANAPMVYNIPARPEGYGAYHAAEIQYVFPKQQTIYAGAPFTAAQTDLSNRMVAFWAQFAKTGNPNASGSSAWPAYSAANDAYLTLAPNAIAVNTAFSAQHQCSSFWTPGV